MTITTRDSEREIKFVTFNALSPQLCNNKIFDLSSSCSIDIRERWKLFSKMLYRWMEEGRIIILQELCDVWISYVTVLLSQNGYYLVNSVYKGGVLGVGIAFPLSEYCMCSSNIFNVGRAYSQTTIDAMNLKTVSRRSSTDHFSTIEINSIIKDFVSGSYLDNRCVSIMLAPIDEPEKTFWVSTYHMPCRYPQPTIMYTHIISLMVHLKKLSGDVPVIFGGDMNVTPDSSGYNILTKRDIPGSVKKLFTHSKINRYPFTGDPLDIEDDMIEFKSMWKEIHKKEPKYTNICITKYKNPFIDTLDYVLFKDMIPLEIKFDPLIASGDLSPKNQCPHPNSVCMSDHLPILGMFIYPTT